MEPPEDGDVIEMSADAFYALTTACWIVNATGDVFNSTTNTVFALEDFPLPVIRVWTSEINVPATTLVEIVEDPRLDTQLPDLKLTIGHNTWWFTTSGTVCCFPDDGYQLDATPVCLGSATAAMTPTTEIVQDICITRMPYLLNIDTITHVEDDVGRFSDPRVVALDTLSRPLPCNWLRHQTVPVLADSITPGPVVFVLDRQPVGTIQIYGAAWNAELNRAQYMALPEGADDPEPGELFEWPPDVEPILHPDNPTLVFMCASALP